MIKKIIPAVVIVIMVVLIVLFFGKIRQHRHIVDPDSARRAGKPLPVSVYAADVAAIRPLLVGSCSTEPSRIVELKSPITDTIVESVLVEVGDTVVEGQDIVILDQRSLRASISRIKDSIRWLQQEVQEKEGLVSYYLANRQTGQSLEIEYRNAVISFIEAQRQLAVAQGELAVSEIDLSKTRIKAPVSGIVDQSTVPGAVARQSLVLVSLRVTDPMYANCEFDIYDYRFLQSKRDTGTVTLRGLEGIPFSATYVRENPKNNNGNLHWVFSLPNPDAEIQSHMEGFIRFSSDQEVTRVPTVAIINRLENSAQLFVVEDDNVARIVAVELGQQGGGYIEVTSGIEAGSRVVVAGQVHLEDGDRVNILDPREVVYPNVD